MNLNHVVVSVNDHPDYLRYVKVFASAWRYFYPNISLHIIYTGTNSQVYELLQQYFDDVFHYPTESFQNSVLAAQISRIYYPCLLQSSNFVVTTDIDLIPLTARYFLNSVPRYNNDSFIVMRNVIAQYRELPIGYNLAIPKTWQDIFHIRTIDQLRKRIELHLNEVSHDGQHGGVGWNYDQRTLWSSVHDRRYQWDVNSDRLILLKDKHSKFPFNRLDRSQKECLDIFLKTDIKQLANTYVDFHMPKILDGDVELFVSKFNSKNTC